MVSSSGRTSPGPRKMVSPQQQQQHPRQSQRQDDLFSSNESGMPSRPKSPFSLPFRSANKRDHSTPVPPAARTSPAASAPSTQLHQPQTPSRRGIFRKKSISSLSMISINDDSDSHSQRYELQGRAPEGYPASPSAASPKLTPPTSSRIPTRAGPPSPSPSLSPPSTKHSTSDRKAHHRRSLSYSGIIQSASKAQSEMVHHISPPETSQHSPSSSRIPISKSTDAPYSRPAPPSPASPRRLYGQDDVQNYIRSGRPREGADTTAGLPPAPRSRSQTPTNTRPAATKAQPAASSPSALPIPSPPRRPSPSHSRNPSLLERATLAASNGNTSAMDQRFDRSPSFDISRSSAADETEDLLSSSPDNSAASSPRVPPKPSSPHDGRSVSVLGIRAEDEPASQTSSPTSRIPKSSGKKPQLNRHGSTASRRSFLGWVSGASSGSGASSSYDTSDTSSIRSSSTQTDHTATPSSPATSFKADGSTGGRSAGLKFPSSPLNFLRSSSALGHYPDRSTTPVPRYPQSSGEDISHQAGADSSIPTQRGSARPREHVTRLHARTPSQASMYSPSLAPSSSSRVPADSPAGTPTKSSHHQSSSSGIPFYRRLRATSTSAKSLLNGSNGRRNEGDDGAAEPPLPTQYPPRAPSAMGGIFSSLQKTKSRDEYNNQHVPQPQAKVATFPALRRNRAETAASTTKRPTKESISQPLGRQEDGRQYLRTGDPASIESLRSASAMGFRDEVSGTPRSPFSSAHSSRDDRATLYEPPRSHSPAPSGMGFSGQGSGTQSYETQPRRERGLRKNASGDGTSSSNSSRHSLFLSSSGSNGGNAGMAGAGQMMASNLKQAGKRGWGMVKGWRGAGAAQADEEDGSTLATSNKARKNNGYQSQQSLSSSRSGSVLELSLDSVLRKWALLPEVVPPSLLATTPGGPQSLIFGVALRDAVIRTRLISPDIDGFLRGRENTAPQNPAHGNDEASDDSSAKRWHQAKRSVPSIRGEALGNESRSAEAASHLRKNVPQMHQRRRPSRIGLLDLGSEFSIASDLFADEPSWNGSNSSQQNDGQGSRPDKQQSNPARASPWSHDQTGSSLSQTRIPVDRFKARRQYLPRFVTRCIESLETYGLTEEGVYRLSGRSTHTNRLRVLFDGRVDLDGGLSDEDDDGFGWDLDLKKLDPIECDINSVCSALKAYLRELPAPVLNREQLKVLAAQAQRPNKAAHAAGAAGQMDDTAAGDALVANALVDMDPAPWYLLRELAYHLGDITEEGVVAKTKMPLSNLSLVLAPTLSIPVNSLAFIVSRRDLLFRHGPKEDVQLDKVHEGDVIGGVVGRDRDRGGKFDMARTASGASTPSSTASPSAFAGSTFSFTMRRSPQLWQQSDGESGALEGDEQVGRPRPRQHLEVDTSARQRNHNRDSSASDATILAGPFRSRSSFVGNTSSSPLEGDSGAEDEDSVVASSSARPMLNGVQEGKGDASEGEQKKYSHSASNSGSTWASSSTDWTGDSGQLSSSGHRSRLSSSNSLTLTSDEEQQGVPPPPVAKDVSEDDGKARQAGAVVKENGGSYTPMNSAREMPRSPGGASAYEGGLSPSTSDGSFAKGGTGAYPRSPSNPSYPSSPRSGYMRRDAPHSPSSPSLAHSTSYSSFASDDVHSEIPRSGRTSAMDRPRPIASGSGSFFGGTGSSLGHSSTVKRTRGGSVSQGQ